MESTAVLTNRLRHSSHHNHCAFQQLRTPGPARIHDIPEWHLGECQPDLANGIVSRINPSAHLRRLHPAGPHFPDHRSPHRCLDSLETPMTRSTPRTSNASTLFVIGSAVEQAGGLPEGSQG